MALMHRAAWCALAGLLTLTLVRAQTRSVLSALPPQPAAPADNPTTPEKVRLGRLLFWDPILSGSQDVACATCHHPNFGYSESLDVSVGVTGIGLGSARRFSGREDVPFVKRNSQTLLNVAFNGIDQSGAMRPSDAPMFWDSRVRSLEAQALEPIKAFEEMRGSAYPEAEAVDVVVRRLAGKAEYRRLFAQAFGQRAPVSAANLAKALASFERSLLAANSPFDRYMRGDATALTAVQLSGMDRFQRAGCSNCHSGPMFSDYKSHVLGVPDNPKLRQSDAGIGNAYAFRTPSLRNLASTGPYMHSGVFTTLFDVLRFYNSGRGRGGSRNPHVSREQLDPLFLQVSVRGGQGEIVAFLEALNDPDFDRTIPDRVPSGLPVGGRIAE